MAFPASEVRFFQPHQHDSESKSLETSDADRFLLTSSKAAGSDKSETQQAVFNREVGGGQVEPQTKWVKEQKICFCSNGLPLARTRWIWSTFSSHCQLPSNLKNIDNFSSEKIRQHCELNPELLGEKQDGNLCNAAPYDGKLCSILWVYVRSWRELRELLFFIN